MKFKADIRPEDQRKRKPEVPNAMENKCYPQFSMRGMDNAEEHVQRLQRCMQYGIKAVTLNAPEKVAYMQHGLRDQGGLQ